MDGVPWMEFHGWFYGWCSMDGSIDGVLWMDFHGWLCGWTSMDGSVDVVVQWMKFSKLVM